MDKLYKCTAVCNVIDCNHRDPHEKLITCEVYCMYIHGKVHCELTNQGFNPEEIILKSFGSANE
jgi:hypothetical protein